jgi:acetate kinase
MFPELNVDGARGVGALLHQSKTGDIVDGNVAEISIRIRPSMIVTSDPSERAGQLRIISRESVVIPIDEELMIARHTISVLDQTPAA